MSSARSRFPSRAYARRRRSRACAPMTPSSKRQSTPVPARFGQRFASDDACRAALVKQGMLLESLVSTVQGMVEMTLILTPSTRRMLRDLEPVLPDLIESETTGMGKAYLNALRAREAATGAVRRA